MQATLLINRTLLPAAFASLKEDMVVFDRAYVLALARKGLMQVKRYRPAIVQIVYRERLDQKYAEKHRTQSNLPPGPWAE